MVWDRKKYKKYSDRSIFNHIYGNYNYYNSDQYYEEYNDYLKNEEEYKLQQQIRRKKDYIHYHIVKGNTTTTKEHIHQIDIKAIKKLGSGQKHIHILNFNTSFEGGHKHKVFGKTGPAIEIENGMHTHQIDGMTTVDNGHVHFFNGYISEDIIK